MLDRAQVPAIHAATLQGRCERLLAAPEGAWHQDDWRRSHPEFPQKYALAIHVYTLQDPNVYKPVASALHDPNRAKRFENPMSVDAEDDGERV